MKNLLLAIAASSLLSGCCIFGYDVSKKYETILQIKLPNGKKREVKETTPEATNAIETCYKEAITKCENETENLLLSEEAKKNRSYLYRCRDPYSRPIFIKYTYRLYDDRTMPLPNKLFWACMTEQGYYRTQKLIKTDISCTKGFLIIQ